MFLDFINLIVLFEKEHFMVDNNGTFSDEGCFMTI